MVQVQVLFHSSKKNLDGKIYTQNLVTHLVEKLLTYKHVFATPTPGPKSMEHEIVCDVISISQKGDTVTADIFLYPAFKHLEDKLDKIAIFFMAKAALTYIETQEILDVDDIMEPIFFTMVQKA